MGVAAAPGCTCGRGSFWSEKQFFEHGLALEAGATQILSLLCRIRQAEKQHLIVNQYDRDSRRKISKNDRLYGTGFDFGILCLWHT